MTAHVQFRRSGTTGFTTGKCPSSCVAFAFVQFLEETGRTTTPGEIDDNLRVLDLFLDRRRAEGYRAKSVSRSRNGGRHLLFWLHHCRLRLADLDEAALQRFCGHDCLCGRPGIFGDGQKQASGVGRLNDETRAFVRFLAAHGLCPKMRPRERTSKDGMDDYRAWLRQNRGIGEKAIRNHICNLLRVVPDIGTRRQDAKCIRNALVDCLGKFAPSYARHLVGSVRMYIRYLASNGQCEPGLVEALPTVAHWRLSTLPKYISPDEMERVFESFDTKTDKGKRDRAIVLLLGRLDLRQPDVSNLKLSDIDWNDASLRVRSKSGEETALPLPQDVGDAMLDYILSARPKVEEDRVFLRMNAPHRPFRYGNMVAHIAREALDRAGVKAPGGGGVRVFRHSAATSLLRSGATLDAVGAVLRHRFRETTTIYAKTDIAMLMQVAQPWIGGGEACR